MILGTAIVGTGFALFFANLHRRQAAKEERDIANPGSIPTCELVKLLLSSHHAYLNDVSVMQGNIA